MIVPIRVVIVDDSPFVCRFLSQHLQASPGIAVAGTALAGQQALDMIGQLKPDVVTLDMEMPGMTGLETLDHIMRDCPVPVVFVSGVSRRSANAALEAVRLGAVDFILKYQPGVDTDPETFTRELTAKVRAASRVKVIRSIRSHTRGAALPPPPPGAPPDRVEQPAAPAALLPLVRVGVIVIGASTGGPVALRELLGNLPGDFPAAVLVIQHMPAAFTGVLAAQLDRAVPMAVREAQAGDRVEPSLALVAPGGQHMLLRSNLRVQLTEGPEIAGHRPSIDAAMQSVAQICGPRATGVVLTGMGNDGEQGLVSIRARGGRTFAQDSETCVVDAMPQRAIERGVVDHIAPPARIARLLRNDFGLL